MNKGVFEQITEKVESWAATIGRAVKDVAPEVYETVRKQLIYDNAIGAIFSSPFMWVGYYFADWGITHGIATNWDTDFTIVATVFGGICLIVSTLFFIGFLRYLGAVLYNPNYAVFTHVINMTRPMES